MDVLEIVYLFIESNFQFLDGLILGLQSLEETVNGELGEFGRGSVQAEILSIRNGYLMEDESGQYLR